MICAQRRWYLCKGLTRKISCVDEEYSPDFLTIKLAIARTGRDLIFSYSRLIWWIIFPYSFGEYVERRKHWLSNPSRGIYSLRGVVVINFIPWDKFGAVHGTLAIVTKLTKSKSRFVNGQTASGYELSVENYLERAKCMHVMKTVWFSKWWHFE